MHSIQFNIILLYISKLHNRAKSITFAIKSITVYIVAKSNYITGQHTKFAIKINSQGNVQNLLLKLYSMIPVLTGQHTNQHTKFAIKINSQGTDLLKCIR